MRGNAPQGGAARAEGHVNFSPKTSVHGGRAALLAGTAMALLAAAEPARAGSGPTLPTGGAFQAGSGSITGGPGSLTVNQGSQRAVIDWKSFSIGQGGTVSFNNGGGATLNRVTGGNLSTILGTLKATGTLYLINPAGVVVGSSGVVVTGGSFTASTLDIANDAFMAGGTLLFKGDTDAEVKNLGKISATGGDVLLIARSVTNDGTITAPNGTVGLAAGQQVLLKDGDAGERVYVQVGSGDVTNTGAIAAAQAELKAAGGNIYALAGNGGGAIRATGTTVKDGHIWLSASGSTETATDQGGAVTVAGTLTATNADGSGGTVIATGKSVAVQAGAVIDASGITGAGGTILLGGDRQGGGDAATKLVKQAVATAAQTTVAASATLKADAGAKGNGGGVIVWSDQYTGFAGALSAKGGPRSGNGGFAEVSSHKLLDFTGTVDLTAPLGAIGQLLLDPENVTISTGSDLNSSLSGGTFTPTGNSSVINTTTLQNTLATADVTITTGNTGSQTGDITVANNVTWAASHSLTLSAYHSIIFNGGTLSHTAGSGDVTLHADNTGTGSGTVTFTSGGVAMTGSSGSVNIFYNPASYASPTSYTGNVTLGSGALTTYMLVNTATNLQNLSTNLSGTYALGRDIDASATATWNSGAGFAPINSFSGTLDGQGHTVTGLTINRPTTVAVGLFGDTVANNGPTVSNLGLVDVNIAGFNRVGGLVGRANGGGSLTNVHVTGSITGYGDFIGGLIGQDELQSISNSWTNVSITIPKGYTGTGIGGLVGYQRSGALTNVYALGDVYAPSMSRVGGLVGTDGAVGFGQGAAVSNAYATGAVTGNDAVGGLIGIAEGGSIATSYATGNVAGVTSVGGLVGINANPITTSWASGGVTLSSGSASSIGGLVGTNGDSVSAGSITSSYWDTYSTGRAAAVGAVVGGSTSSAAAVTSDPAQSAASTYAYKTSAYGGFNFTTDWWLSDGGTRPLGLWEYSLTVSNAHQLQLVAHDLTASYTQSNDIRMPAPTAGGIWKSTVGSVPAGFIPLGSPSTPFSGTYDGQGHAIDGLTINYGGGSNTYIGLFGGNSGTLNNIALTNAAITVTNADSHVGALVGANNGGHIVNAYVTGTLNFQGGGGYGVGGIVGIQYNSGTITGSTSLADINLSFVHAGQAYAGDVLGVTADLSATAINTSHAGGTITVTGGGGVGGQALAGGLAGISTNISNSYSTATVTETAGRSADEIGGLVGQSATGTISNSYASGAVSAPGTTVGGLIGFNVSATVNNSYWDKQTTGLSSGVGSGSATGVTGRTTAEMAVQSNFSGWDFSNTWYLPAGLSRPVLRAEASTTIRDAHELQLVALNPTARYTIANDIGLATPLANAADIWGGGFIPIATFSGELSGQGHTISGLTITGSANNQGLFASTTASASLANLALTNVSVSGGNNVGALVGSATGTTISNITVSGTVSGASQVGGVVGSATGAISFAGMSGTVSATADSVGGVVGFTNGTIADSWSTAAVSSSGTSSHGLYVGGLVGQSTGTINRSWASGAVSGWTDVGGLVGLASGNITTSSASGNVTGGGSVVGGLVGNLYGASLTNTYATGDVTGFQEEGGLVGIIQVAGASINNSYASGRVSSTIGSIYTSGLVGLSSVTFTASNSFWDVTTTGRSYGAASGGSGLTVTGFTGITSSQAFSSTTFSNAGWDMSGTWYMVDGGTRPMLVAEASATVRTAHQLQLTNLNPGLGYTLANDIDLGSALSATGGVWGSGGFSPVTNFAGTFNGGGHAISGLTINRPGSSNVGLFASTIGTGGTGYLHDLTLNNVSVTGSTAVGALVGTDGGANISHVSVTGSITGASTVGGLIGAITGGGLLRDAKADILITASGTDVGGLVGNSNGTIQGSYALGGIRMTAAGGAQSVGGLVGNNSVDLVNSLIGTITDDYAQVALLGVVNSGSAAGGLVGTNSGTVARTYSIGALALTGTTTLGGLIGSNGGTVSNSFYDTETSGLSVGVGGGTTSGVTGKTTAQMQTRSTFTGAGWDYTTPVWGMIDGVTLPYFTWEHSGGVQIVTGTAYSDAAGSSFAIANRVSALTNGTSLGSGFAGANGYYYILADGSPITGGNLVAYLNPALGNTTLGNAVHLTTSGGTTTGLTVLGTTVQMTSDGPAVSTSALASARPSGIDSSLLYTVSGGTITLSANASLDIEAGSHAITVDDALTVSGTGTLTLNSTGISTQSAAITTPSLLLLGSGGTWQLGGLSSGNSINNIGTLAANTGSVLVGSNTALAVGSVGTTDGITLTGGLGFIGASTSVTQTKAITAGGLALEGGSYTLTNTGNAFGHFTANGASFSVVTSGAVTVDSVTAGGTTYDGLILSGTGANSLTAGTDLTVATPTNSATLAAGGTLTLTAGGNLTVTDTNLSVGGGSGASTLTLVAGGTITLQGTTSLTVDGTATAALSLAAYADSDSSGTGGIVLNNVTITTRGGGLALVGGAVVSDPTTAGAAHSTGLGASNDAAISLTNSTITLGGGNAVLKGDGQASVTGTSSGIVLNTSSLTTTGGGTLALTGSATTSTAAGAHLGLQLVSSTLQAATGAVTLTGTAAAGPGGNTGLLINGGGVTATTGAISLSGTGTGGTGLRLYGETLSTTSGAVSLTGSGATGTGLVLGDGVTTAASIGSGTQTGAITLTSDDFALASGAAPTITTTGTVTLRQQSADRALAVGGSVTGADVLSAAGINGVTAGALIIGRTDISETAGYTIAGAIAPTVTTLSLMTGGAISQTSGSAITATNLALRAGGDIGLATAANSVGTLAATTSAGSVSFKDSGALTVGTVDGLSGVTAITTAQLTAGAGGLLTVSQAVSGTGVTLTADRMNLANAVTATGGGTVTLAPVTSGWTVDLGSTSDATAGTLELSAAELDRVTAGTLVVDPPVSGDIVISAAIAPAHASTLVLEAGGTITQASGATITVGSLGLNAGGAITLTQTNSAGTLAATAGGAMAFANAGALTIGTAGGISGITAIGGVAITTSGTLTLTNAVTSQATGDAVTLSTTGAFINTAGSSAITAASGRWLVYSATSAGDTFGNLDSGNTALWNRTLASGTVAVGGNRYVFAEQPTLVITASDVTKTYGQDVSGALAYTLSGGAAGVAHAYLGGASLGTAPTLISTGAGSGANVGGYTITASGATTTDGSAISYVAGTLTVNKAALTVTANNATVTYGQTPTLGASYSGFVNGETASVLGGSLTVSGAGTNAGSYTLTPGGLTSANYDISYVAGTLTVNKAALTVTANTTTVTYGQTPTLGASYSGFVNGETASVLGGTLTVSGAGTNAGSYTLTLGGLTAANYDISYIAGTLTVNKAALTVTANTTTVTYGQTPTLGASYSGFVNGETASVLGGSLTVSGAGTNAGSYTLTPGGLISANYDISYVAGTLTVNKAALTVTANNATVTYGQAPTLGASYSGFVNGETASVLGGSLTVSGAGTNAGGYTLTPGGLTSANYDISYVAGTLTVNKAALTVTATNATVTYGQAPTLGASYSGFVNGERASVLGGTLTVSGVGTNAGSYTLTPGGLTSANYDISYVAGTLTVNRAPLTVTANDVTIAFGGTPAYSARYNGFVNGETAAVLGGSLVYNGGGTAAGTYTITPGGLTSGNYLISYASGTLTVQADTSPPVVLPEVPSSTHFVDQPSGKVPFTPTQPLVGSDYSQGNYRIIYLAPPATTGGALTSTSTFSAAHQDGTDETEFEIAKRWR
ncbi:MBG domain-containing protein [Nitrospirillum sp. BR 11163]|uniref:MBG domain-containing protein n=1 Tax=Nitrospirillum sp. BR 11163 TaxID=3104323 RepID=UPI002AFDCDC6|nr:MBG domain-containing protein [Nitrospirillum sp. BR 11163]MEA1671883.1 MBG domain-containing protein [Nitrospirillum sp. BR 11163]